jgi:hypothetical protein
MQRRTSTLKKVLSVISSKTNISSADTAVAFDDVENQASYAFPGNKKLLVASINRTEIAPWILLLLPPAFAQLPNVCANAFA